MRYKFNNINYYSFGLASQLEKNDQFMRLDYLFMHTAGFELGEFAFQFRHSFKVLESRPLLKRSQASFLMRIKKYLQFNSPKL